MAAGGTRSPRIFLLSWASYVGFYLCRRNLSIVLPALAHDRGYTVPQLSHMVLVFSVAYCLGQFVMGRLNDTFGARRVVTAGMLSSAAFSAALALTSHYAAALVCVMLNGLAQSAGWSGLMQLMKLYGVRRRGVLMGWWSTNYAVGGFCATILASYALGAAWLPVAQWQRAVLLPAAALFALALLFYASSSTLGVGSAEQKLFRTGRDVSLTESFAVFRRALSIGRIRILASSYFFTKMIRYSLLFWLPLYLTASFRMTPSQAGYASARFELYGIVGVLVAAYLSDYAFGSRRFPVAMLMLLCFAGLCQAISLLPGDASSPRIILLIGLLGWSVYGADTILVGAATQDSAGTHYIGTVAGIVDGAGSAGQILSPVLIAFVSDRFGWGGVFHLLTAIALVCVLLLAAGSRFEHAQLALTTSLNEHTESSSATDFWCEVGERNADKKDKGRIKMVRAASVGR